ncbi:MAG: stage III sporulation protein AG [Gemmiger sp.]
MIDELKKRLDALATDRKRLMNLLILAGIAGMLLIALSEWIPEAEEAPKQTGSQTSVDTQEDYAACLERRLTELLACEEGVGRVRVMVTLVTNEQTIYAKDRQYDDGALREESHVLVSGNEPALVETVAAPEILGIAVICDGGGNASVASSVTQILSALTGVGASHISVSQMTRSDGS